MSGDWVQLRLQSVRLGQQSGDWVRLELQSGDWVRLRLQLARLGLQSGDWVRLRWVGGMKYAEMMVWVIWREGGRYGDLISGSLLKWGKAAKAHHHHLQKRQHAITIIKIILMTH